MVTIPPRACMARASDARIRAALMDGSDEPHLTFVSSTRTLSFSGSEIRTLQSPVVGRLVAGERAQGADSLVRRARHVA